VAAIRVAVMSLTLLSLASPAAAQFSASDLNGTWFMRGLVVGAAVDNGAAFANGTVTFNASRIVTPGSLSTAAEAAEPAMTVTGRTQGALVTTTTTESGAYANLSQGDNSPAFNDAGMVAFWAGLPAGSSGIFTGPIPAAGKVLQTGDPLFGSTVVETSLGGLNNRGEITFRARLSNGRQVIGVATPPRP